MKISKCFFLLSIMLAASALAQYPVVPIDSIQWVPCGDDSSRIAGDTVITGGLVVAGTGLYYAGTGVTFYMESPEGGPFSGIMAYNADALGFPPLIPGDSILFTAEVSEYGSAGPPFVTMTELLIVPNSFQYRMYGMPEPDPTGVLATEIDSTGEADSCGEQYEGVFIKVFDLTVDTVINYTTTSVWVCHDSTGTCFVREASDSISNDFRPPVGTVFDYVQGVVYHRFGAYHLQPRYMRDMRLGRGAPIVSSWHSPLFPLVGELVTITANVVDDSGIPQDSVRLLYCINLGTWTNVPMSYQGNDNYTLQLPSPVAGWNVDYYIHAVDDSNNVTNDPPEAPFDFNGYIVQQPRQMTIAQARVDANADFVPDLLDSAVILTGIAVSPNFSTDWSDFFMQQDNAGIEAYFDSSLITVTPGDSITISGIIDQYNGKTQIRAYRGDRITNHGPGHLPPVRTITCADLADINGEAFEGTLVQVENVEVLEIPDQWPPLGYSATMTITNGPDSATLRIDRTTDIDGQPQSEPRATIVGVVSQYDNYSPYLGYYELMPRYYSDFTWISGIDDEGSIPDAYALRQNYPNPFNPTTSIEFSLKKAGYVTVSVYNLMGQKVVELLNQKLQPGKHIIVWDGRNSAGQSVDSGVYFYRLQANEYDQSRKMVLLK